MTTLLIIIHVLVCLFLIAIVLLQHGKGADIGATFGGSSQSLFGSEGPVPLLNKITTFSAIVFMGTSVTLAYLSAHKSSGSVMSSLPAKEVAAPVQKEEPVTIPMPTTEQQAEPAPTESVQSKEADPPAVPVAAEESSPAAQEAESPAQEEAAGQGQESQAQVQQTETQSAAPAAEAQTEDQAESKN